MLAIAPDFIFQAITSTFRFKFEFLESRQLVERYEFAYVYLIFDTVIKERVLWIH